jgi:hypothetical protein
VPIDFFTASDGVHVRQSFVSPTVYLDHWAVRLFSDDLHLQDRFVSALMSKSGTLLLSNISFVEFAAASDPQHCYDTETFIERLLPNIYLTDFALDKVLEKESGERSNAKRFWPSADLPQLKLLAERAQSASSGLTLRGFVSLAHVNRTQLSQSIEELIRMVGDGLNSARSNASYVDKARNIRPSDERPRTLLILGELLRDFTLDPRRATISKNDVIDLLHAAMPLNCCDYILLDGPWAERVVRMKQRISKTSMKMPVAQCFSQRDNGVEAFLADLAVFDKAAHLTDAACP